MRTFVGAAVITCYLSLSAGADSAGDVLKSFGLIGAWSPDCAENPEDPSARTIGGRIPTRWIFTTSDVSGTKMTVLQRMQQRLLNAQRDVVSADQVTADKLKYKAMPTTMKVGNNPEQKVAAATASTTVVQKRGDKITVLQQVADDGTLYIDGGWVIARLPVNGVMQEVNRTPFGEFERCLN